MRYLIENKSSLNVFTTISQTDHQLRITWNCFLCMTYKKLSKKHQLLNWFISITYFSGEWRITFMCIDSCMYISLGNPKVHISELIFTCKILVFIERLLIFTGEILNFKDIVLIFTEWNFSRKMCLLLGH